MKDRDRGRRKGGNGGLAVGVVKVGDLEQGVGPDLVRGLQAAHVGHGERRELDVDASDVPFVNI